MIVGDMKNLWEGRWWVLWRRRTTLHNTEAVSFTETEVWGITMNGRDLHLVWYRASLGQCLEDGSRHQGGPLKAVAGSVAETVFSRENHGEGLLWAPRTAVSGRQETVSVDSGIIIEVRMVAFTGRKIISQRCLHPSSRNLWLLPYIAKGTSQIWSG